jgi:hypothetical protein
MALRQPRSNIDPRDLSEETLDRLLAMGHEEERLDFKRVLDLSSDNPSCTKDKVELAKDISAMVGAGGGYIVLGADDQGNLTGQMDSVRWNPFDEANLSNMMGSYLEGPPRISSKRFERDGHKVVAILIHPSPEGCCYCKAAGQYQKPNGQNELVFRDGDVFGRRGTKSVRIKKDGLEDIIQWRLEAEKENLRKDHEAIAEKALVAAIEQLEGRLGDRFDAAVDRMVDVLSDTGVASPPISSRYESREGGQWSPGETTGLDKLDFTSSEPKQLYDAALETARQGDMLSLQQRLVEAVGEARVLIERDDIEEGLGELLDRLTCVAAVYIQFGGLESWLEAVLDALRRIYSLPLNEPDARNADWFAYNVNFPSTEKPPRVWLQVVHRVFSLGGLAVRSEAWEAVATLTLQRPAVLRDYDKNWLRHALTMASRADLLKANGGKESSLIMLAVEDTLRLEGCPVAGGDSPDEDALINSVAEFDVLSNIVAIGDAKDVDHGGVFYPNFARFRGDRIQRIVERLLNDDEMRSILFDLADDDLAIALQGISQRARSEGWAFDGFMGWNPDIEDFIVEHLPSTDS